MSLSVSHEMPSLPNNMDPAKQSSSVALSTAFLALRERSRELLRERSQQLAALEAKLEDQLTQVLVESTHQQSAQQQSAGKDSDSARLRISALEAEIKQLTQLRRDSEQALDEARVMLVEMEHERRTLCDRMDAADSGKPSAEVPDSSAEIDRLQRRLELALQEIRELKQQNQELTTRSPQSGPAPRAPAADAKSWDWETQKQRFLEELATDFDASQPAQAKEKLRIEEVISETDGIVGEKDRKLEELRQQLAELTAIRPESPAEAAAREGLLDADVTVSTERARLLQLQEEWREKLRKSEVEISIERAKLARERLQLEERIRSLPAAPAETNEDGKKSDDPKSGGSPRGRWLTRLGLNGGE